MPEVDDVSAVWSFREPLWPSGKALVRRVSGQSRFDSVLRLSFVFTSFVWDFYASCRPDITALADWA